MHDLHDPGARAPELLRDDDTTVPSRNGAMPDAAVGGTDPIPRPRTASRLLARAARYAGLVVAGLVIIVIAHLMVYRFFNPPFTTLTAARWIAGETIEQTWVPLNRISPQLRRAVVASEDARFCRHWGIDPGALEAAFEDWWSGTPRGGSTISMQVVKNLFLWPQRSLVRKAVELPLALLWNCCGPSSGYWRFTSTSRSGVPTFLVPRRPRTITSKNRRPSSAWMRLQGWQYHFPTRSRATPVIPTPDCCCSPISSARACVAPISPASLCRTGAERRRPHCSQG